ncbi:MAG TPA: uracil-DNA glycosylase [Sphingomonas sp.]|jgi:uracil-DNA glycosylase|uniref:uracil-DNA glycosylase n=1 Tax=Sphingomonas sp. TaxID=28214 RepID=UPI002EDADE0A
MIADLPTALATGWHAALAEAFAQPSMAALRDFLAEAVAAGRTVFPPMPDIFRALELTPPDAVRVVILGQDPYHGAGQAHGLSFSVRPGVRVPPSLVNIYKELQDDLGIAPVAHGYLEAWARQGVLLLNDSLTVEQGKAGSHRRQGWERFTDAVVRVVDRGPPTVFLLWGAAARKKAAAVDAGRHLVIHSSHPSPLYGSAHKGFFGSRPFSRANAFLAANGRGMVDWALPERV